MLSFKPTFSLSSFTFIPVIEERSSGHAREQGRGAGAKGEGRAERRGVRAEQGPREGDQGLVPRVTRPIQPLLPLGEFCPL